MRSSIDRFIARYSPAIAVEFRAARRIVARHFPRGYELVYDNYNALGVGFSPTPKSSGVIVSVVAYPRWITLFFFHGTRLKDPGRILQGSGRRIRSVRLQPFALLKCEEVADLLHQAAAAFQAQLAVAPRRRSIIKSVSARQRPRRPASA